LVVGFAFVWGDLPETFVFAPIAAWIVIDYVVFVRGVVLEIAEYLEIPVFRIVKKGAPELINYTAL
jgi:hypothetical protein